MVVTDVSTASATVTSHVTLIMTTAEAVETSVTAINSLSQDFINLDYQTSQTLILLIQDGMTKKNSGLRQWPLTNSCNLLCQGKISFHNQE